MDLINQLTDQLGVSEDQAQGGAGLLFRLAKEKLAPGEFSQIAESVPGVDQLVESAPRSRLFRTALGRWAAGLTSSYYELGNLGHLASGFSQLGLDTKTVGKFVPIIISFVQRKGGESAKSIVSKALKSEYLSDY